MPKPAGRPALLVIPNTYAAPAQMQPHRHQRVADRIWLERPTVSSARSSPTGRSLGGGRPFPVRIDWSKLFCERSAANAVAAAFFRHRRRRRQAPRWRPPSGANGSQSARSSRRELNRMSPRDGPVSGEARHAPAANNRIAGLRAPAKQAALEQRPVDKDGLSYSRPNKQVFVFVFVFAWARCLFVGGFVVGAGAASLPSPLSLP